MDWWGPNAWSFKVSIDLNDAFDGVRVWDVDAWWKVLDMWCTGRKRIMSSNIKHSSTISNLYQTNRSKHMAEQTNQQQRQLIAEPSLGAIQAAEAAAAEWGHCRGWISPGVSRSFLWHNIWVCLKMVGILQNGSKWSFKLWTNMVLTLINPWFLGFPGFSDKQKPARVAPQIPKILTEKRIEVSSPWLLSSTASSLLLKSRHHRVRRCKRNQLSGASDSHHIFLDRNWWMVL